MLIRALIAAALLSAPISALAASPKRHHHAARVSTATFRIPIATKPGRELRASRSPHDRASRTRYAVTHHHILTRGS